LNNKENYSIRNEQAEDLWEVKNLTRKVWKMKWSHYCFKVSNSLSRLTWSYKES